VGGERDRGTADQDAETTERCDCPDAATPQRESLRLGDGTHDRQDLTGAETEQQNAAQHDDDVDGERRPADQHRSGKQRRTTAENSPDRRTRRPGTLAQARDPGLRGNRAQKIGGGHGEDRAGGRYAQRPVREVAEVGVP
jgi:hypothetical protein